ncbi:hypothetical protein EDC34_101584 [Thermomonas haemolytica]|uniref:Uncharacterized protein n=2 Tax=Thermomonas haemolytica TaxID=141949 RepID=A0A4R3NAI3_9GAMM|nr:hypothetical protein EDC34_101584 [Thermomonas haemolytica]
MSRTFHLPLLLVLGSLSLGLAHAQSTDNGQSSAQRITIKQPSSNEKWCKPWPDCRYNPDNRRTLPPQAPGNAAPGLPRQPGMQDDPPPPPHPVDPLPPKPRSVGGAVELPTAPHLPRDPGMGNGQMPRDPGMGNGQMPRDPGMGNGQMPPAPRPLPKPGVGNGGIIPNPGGNPVEPALPCPPGYVVVHLKNGQTSCAKPTPTNPTPPAATAKQAASGQDHVQICPPYCGSNGPQATDKQDKPGRPVLINRPEAPKPIEDRLARPNGPGSEQVAIPVKSADGSTAKRSAGPTISKCPAGWHWVSFKGHCERDGTQTQ